MKLEELYPNYDLFTPDERLRFIAEYRQKRALDLSKSEELTPKKQATLLLSEEEKVLMKLLGIKAKDIKALRALKDEPELHSEEITSPGEDAILFDDDNLMMEVDE